MASCYRASPTSAAALNEKAKNDSAHLRGGRRLTRAGRSLPGSVSIQLWLSAAQSLSRHSALSHRSARRSSRCLPELRSSGHLLQLVQKPALPQVPDASAQTLLEIAINPKHLGAEIGLISILHTWGQNLLLHPHIHCAIPAGGLSPDHRRWIRPRYPFFLPVKVLSRVFRGKFLAGLKRLHRRNQLGCAGPAAALADPQQFAKLLRRLHRHDWVVYAKQAFGGPLQVLRYLGRYTHRVAISNHRLLAFDQERVT